MNNAVQGQGLAVRWTRVKWHLSLQTLEETRGVCPISMTVSVTPPEGGGLRLNASDFSEDPTSQLVGCVSHGNRLDTFRIMNCFRQPLLLTVHSLYRCFSIRPLLPFPRNLFLYPDVVCVSLFVRATHLLGEVLLTACTFTVLQTRTSLLNPFVRRAARLELMKTE